MEPHDALMSRSSRAAKTKDERIRRWGWKAPLKWMRAAALRYTGWKCEGPFPRLGHQALLILGPGLDAEKWVTSVVEHKLSFSGIWAADPFGSIEPATLPLHDLILVDYRTEHLVQLIGQAHARGIPIQLVRVAHPEKRIRCNTPFTPSKFLRRDLAYIRRVFSYNN